MIWTLDSCSPGTNSNCIVEVDSNFTFIRFISKCPIHQNLTNDVAGFNVLWNPNNTGENQRGPGNVFAEILDGAPTSLFDIEGTATRVFKKGITVTCNWTGTVPNRVLNVNIVGTTLTQNQQNAVMTKLNNRFGINNVVLTFS